MGVRGRTSAIKLGLDVEPASGSGPWHDMGASSINGLAYSIELKTLVGGSFPGVTPTLEHSPDKSAIHVLDAGSPLTNVGDTELYVTRLPCFRYVRVSWTTSGTPTSTTADVHIDSRRG